MMTAKSVDIKGGLIVGITYHFKYCRATDSFEPYTPAPALLKPQPFWTQQGRRKKGGRGKY